MIADLTEVYILADKLERVIKDSQSIKQKAACLELGVQFVNAVLQRYRLDEELLEDLHYEMNKHLSHIDRERVEFLWERFIPIFDRVKFRLDALRKAV
jgi:hypothetical protein